MSRADLERAVQLYREYKTDSREFRLLAEKYGSNTADLTAVCWRVAVQTPFRRGHESQRRK